MTKEIKPLEHKYYFLAGFHRSGNTVLSALLNQHPEIYSSPLSPVCDYLWELHRTSLCSENNRRVETKFATEDLLSSLLKTYHQGVKKPVILDREKNWGSPANLSLILEYLNKDPKIIFTVRPLVEILSSYITVAKDMIVRDMKNDGWIVKKWLTDEDNICEYLMRPGGPIDMSMWAYNSIMNPEYRKFFHIVEYNQLVDSPQKIMDSVYEFLEVTPFKNDFKNIKKIEEDLDGLAGLPKDLHVVRPKLSKKSKNPKRFFSDYTYEKYSNMDFYTQF
jgi:sulfotransferase